MKNRRQSAAKVPHFSKKVLRKQGRDARFERNWVEMSPALLKIAKRRRKAKDRDMREVKWRRKVCSKQDWKCSSEDSSVDRISMLPDEVLGLILSHFTLKEQMAFSILSRRWRYLWTLTTRLDFDGITLDSLERRRQEKGTSLETEKLNYVSWVNRVLASCQGPTTEDFIVRFNMSKNDGECINEWLRYALAKNVKTLVLNFTDYLARRKGDECYVFPYMFLHTVEEIRFKQLEKISLDHVSVDGEALKFFLHNCPVLEDLSVSNSSQLSILSLSGPFPLKRLVVWSCDNLILLEIRHMNLVYLGYNAHIRRTELRLHNLPKLINLSISMGTFYHMNFATVQFSSILGQLEALYLFQVSGKFRIPRKMSNLRQLEITYYTCFNRSHLWLADVIRSVPSLQKFVLKARDDFPKFHDRELERTKIKKWYGELKEVEFWGFVGVPKDLEFVLHLVDNGAGLKRIVIDPRVRITSDGDMYNKDLYSEEELIGLDGAQKQLALQLPAKIKLDFLHPRRYPPLRLKVPSYQDVKFFHHGF